jgi:hypothetical protein
MSDNEDSKINFPNLYLKNDKKNLFSKFKKPIKHMAPIYGNFGDYQCDLMFIDYGQFNSGYKIILNLINVTSRYLFSELIKMKSEASDVLINLIRNLPVKMTELTVDAGNEFINHKLKDYLTKNNIILNIVNKSNEHVSTATSIVERVNGTIRMLIERYIDYAQKIGLNKGLTKFNFTKAFSDIISQYNNNIHRSLGLTPSECYLALENPDKHPKIIKQLDEIKYQKVLKMLKLQEKIKKEFPINSKVLVKLPENKFEKGATAKFADEIYTVVNNDKIKLLVENNNNKKKVLYTDIVKTTDTKVQKIEGPTVKQLKKEKTLNYKNKREELNSKNIITSKREIKPKKIIRSIVF